MVSLIEGPIRKSESRDEPRLDFLFLSVGLSGEVPKWPTGEDCKSSGSAFAGSNPALSTTFGRAEDKVSLRVWVRFF